MSFIVFVVLLVLKILSLTDISWLLVFGVPIGMKVSYHATKWMVQ